MTASTIKKQILDIILEQKDYFDESDIAKKCKEQDIENTFVIREILEELFEKDELLVEPTSKGNVLYKVKE